MARGRRGVQQTLCVIKPDAVVRGLVGRIIARLEEHGFRIRAMKILRFSREQAQDFYRTHAGRPFFETLVTFMSSGPAVAMILEREDAVLALRELMGPSYPQQPAPGTIRGDYAEESPERNAIHGSDSRQTAAVEIPFFFSFIERV